MLEAHGYQKDQFAPQCQVNDSEDLDCPVTKPLPGQGPAQTPEWALAPVRESVLAPVQEWALAPVQEWALAPVREWALAPVREWALAPVQEWVLVPVQEWALALVQEWALAPVLVLVEPQLLPQQLLPPLRQLSLPRPPGVALLVAHACG